MTTVTPRGTARAPSTPLVALCALLAASSARSQISFSDATAGANLGTLFTAGDSHSGGCAWIDYNNDYWPDLFVTNGTGRSHFLFRNNGNGTFTDVTAAAIPKANLAYGECSSIFGDIDNDGDSDLVVVVDAPATSLNTSFAGGPNLLYENLGNGTFQEVGDAAGIRDPFGRRNHSGGLADFDRDGFLDLYLSISNGTPASVAFKAGRLLHNDGDGTFTQVQPHVHYYGRNALVVMWADFNLDLWPDLYVGCAGEPFPDPMADDVLYMNRSGKLREFPGRAESPNLRSDAFEPGPLRPGELVNVYAEGIGDDAYAAMGLDVGDVDNDGDWDLYITDTNWPRGTPVGNVLYLGEKGGFRDNTADVAGVAEAQTLSMWPCNFVDLNNDQWVDLWVGSQYGADNPVFVNNRDGSFSRSTPAVMQDTDTLGGSTADYDGDGDVDIFVWNHNQSSILVRNDTGAAEGNWLQVKLFGTLSNRDAIGARITVAASGVKQMRRVSGGESAHSQTELAVHFGMAAQTSADVTVYWPSGTVTTLTAVPTNQLIFVDETQGLLAESLTTMSAVYDISAAELRVIVRSSFGGRTGFGATGHGALDWRAIDRLFSKTFTGVASAPTTVDVVSTRGGQWSLPVTIVP